MENQHKPTTLTFSTQEINILLEGLGELPGKKSWELIVKLRDGWNKAQNNPTDQQPPEKPKKELKDKP